MVAACAAPGPTAPAAPAPSTEAHAARPPRSLDPAVAPTITFAHDPGAARVAKAFALPDGPRDDDPLAPLPPPLSLTAWHAARAAKNVPLPPARCAAYAKRAAATSPPRDLPSALAVADPASRDALLVALVDQLQGEKQVWLQGLRADLAPPECADVIIDPHLVRLHQLDNPASNVLVGLSIAAKLARTTIVPPSMWGVRDKEKVKAFLAGPLKAWFAAETAAIDDLAAGAAGLSSYGQAIAMLEIGVAELRLVERVRASLSPTMPSTWDDELRAHYTTVLQNAVDVRKSHGRDAVLLGLASFAQVGILVDGRVERARAILARAYPERRIDALDALILPPRPRAPAAASPLATASRLVPTYWLGFVGAEPDSIDVLVRGVPQPARAHHRAANLVSEPELNSAFARTRFEMGRIYWRRVDFVEAAHAAYFARTQDDRLVLALALALVNAPDGAAAMMAASSRASFHLTSTESLDMVATEPGPQAGMAAFDAAYLRSLSVPDGPGGALYLRDVAARFRRAESLLGEPSLKARATARALEAEDLASAASSAASD